MLKKLLYLTIPLAMSMSFGQPACPEPNGPKDGDTGVAVDAEISWTAVDGAAGYLISIGTSPGGSDIVNQDNTRLATTFEPPVGLPEKTEIFVSLTVFLFNAEIIECSGFSFTTENVTSRPGCTVPNFPVQELTDVYVGSTISWNYAPKATGYRLTLGTSEGSGNILNGEEIIGTPFYDPPADFPEGTEIFVQIVPFNENGSATANCEGFSFTTREREVFFACSGLTTPANGSIGVPVDTPIRWSKALDALGYVISIGTSPGATDIVENRSSGLRNYYIPETGLPTDTQLYVNIGFFRAGQEFTSCQEGSFSTETIITAPECTQLLQPQNGALDIPVDTKLEWNYAPDAIGYILTAGSTPGGTDVFDNLDVGNQLSYLPADGLPADRPVFITVVPYNEIGKARTCSEESFTTDTIIIDCDDFFDESSGQSVPLYPEISFPDEIGFCTDRSTTLIESTDMADGFRWYAIDSEGNETLLTTDRSVELSSNGSFRYEAYNLVTRSGVTVECANSKLFTAIVSEAAVIESIEDEFFNGRKVQVNVSGSGAYEFALDSPEGPYQISETFENVSSGSHTIYVRDINGCGITQSSIEPKALLDKTPNFFTPNGDNINDYWKLDVTLLKEGIILTDIHIFDRYGTLLAVIDPRSRGWDGSAKGRELPESDYWFKATTNNGGAIKGHFTLKR